MDFQTLCRLFFVRNIKDIVERKLNKFYNFVFFQPLTDVVKHVEVGYKMEAPEGCPPEIYEMMRQAWDLNPAKRPTFAELKVKLLHLKNNTA